MAAGEFRDPLSIDISRDLERVDGVITTLLKDRSLWGEFFRNPNDVLVRLGLHPPTSEIINERANRIFYAALTNKKLIRLLAAHYGGFKPRQARKFHDFYDAGLKRGVIQHALQFDLEGVRHLLKSPATLRAALKLTLRDLNDKRLLETYHQPGEIDRYIDKLATAIEARLPVDEHPRLETWDRHYGVGRPHGAIFVEVAAVVTLSSAAELAVVVTAVVVAEVEVTAEGPTVAALRAATEGDRESIRAVATMGRLLDFGGELLVHAHNFEKGSSS
jgi:hypothetical protein